MAFFFKNFRWKEKQLVLFSGLIRSNKRRGHEEEKRRENGQFCVHRSKRRRREEKRRSDTSSLSVLSVSFGYERQLLMAQMKFISLSRLWYTLLVVIVQTILIVNGFRENFPWPKTFSSTQIDLILQKLSLVSCAVLLVVFIYPSLFRIENFANDQRQLTFEHLENKSKRSFCSNLWQNCFALSSFLHLLMSFLLIISDLLIDGRRILAGSKQTAFLIRTDLDFVFDSSTSNSLFRLTFFNFLFASSICVVREPSVFWSISKTFSLIYSFALALNVVQWSLMFAAFQLVLKNICFYPIDSSHRIGFFLIGQPYTGLFLYLLLEFLVFISSITFYFYGFQRLKRSEKIFTCYDRCSKFCPSLIAVVLLLLYTSCKMPLVHDIFLLYIETRRKILLTTFVFEIVHVLIILAIWIFLTTKVDWRQNTTNLHGLTVKNTPIQQSTAVSMPELSKPFEKIRIFQSEIYYHDRPKNWSLPVAVDHRPSIIATFDQDDDNDSTELVVRSPSYPLNPSKSNGNVEIQYRDAIRKTVSNIYKSSENDEIRRKTPPTPPVKRFSQEQVDAARQRAQQLIIQRQHHRSAALLISQV